MTTPSRRPARSLRLGDGLIDHHGQFWTVTRFSKDGKYVYFTMRDGGDDPLTATWQQPTAAVLANITFGRWELVR